MPVTRPSLDQSAGTPSVATLCDHQHGAQRCVGADPCQLMSQRRRRCVERASKNNFVYKCGRILNEKRSGRVLKFFVRLLPTIFLILQSLGISFPGSFAVYLVLVLFYVAVNTTIRYQQGDSGWRILVKGLLEALIFLLAGESTPGSGAIKAVFEHFNWVSSPVTWLNELISKTFIVNKVELSLTGAICAGITFVLLAITLIQSLADNKRYRITRITDQDVIYLINGNDLTLAQKIYYLEYFRDDDFVKNKLIKGETAELCKQNVKQRFGKIDTDKLNELANSEWNNFDELRDLYTYLVTDKDSVIPTITTDQAFIDWVNAEDITAEKKLAYLRLKPNAKFVLNELLIAVKMNADIDEEKAAAIIFDQYFKRFGEINLKKLEAICKKITEQGHFNFALSTLYAYLHEAKTRNALKQHSGQRTSVVANGYSA